MNMKGNTMKNLKSNPSLVIQKSIEYCVIIMIISWFLFISRIMFAQTIANDEQTPEKEVELYWSSPEDTLAADTLAIEPGPHSKPYVGLVFGWDMDFEKAQDMHYPYNYGAYVEEVKPGGPAETAGIKEADIITSVGGDKVHCNDQFAQLIETRNVGDAVPIILFRNNKMIKTSIVLAAAPAPISPVEEEEEAGPEIHIETAKHLRYSSFGQGVMAWDLAFYAPDNREFFNLIEGLGYSSLLEGKTVNDKIYQGLKLNGFQIVPGDHGDAVQIGFAWANGNMDRHRLVTEGEQTFQRNLKYSISYWGMTLDARAMFFNRLVLSAGILGGFMETELALYQNNGNVGWNQINQTLVDQKQNYLSAEKGYYIIQPNAALLLRLAGNLGVQFKVGYFYGIPRYSGWKVVTHDRESNVLGSPNSSIGGFTFSVGPALIIN
jgi:hypothetical protein